MSDMYEWDMDRPENVVYVVGLGPGDVSYLTQEAQSALEHADAICGYKLYIDLIEPEFPCEEYYATGMTQEIDRCRWALEKARTGKRVALVCSGDAGVYGMASPLLELAEDYPDVAVEVVPGLTAALSGGAVLGAPLAHDFCVISLSDRLTPWLTLAELEDTPVDMFTTVYIGNGNTRALSGRMVTPRGYRK